MDIKFDVSLYSEVLGTLYKDNEIDLDGLEAKVDLNLDEVNGMAVNFEVGGKSYTDYVEIKNRMARTVQIPFKTSVLKAGNNSFELVATMKNGDVKTSRTYAYQIVKSLENPNAVEADTHYPILIDLINQVSAITANGESGGESSGHTHSNKTVLDGITSSKVNEWNNKADKNHTHSQYLTALPTHNHSYNDLSDKPVIPSIEGLATESYVRAKIAEASLSGGEVNLSDYYTKSEVDNKDQAIDDKITVLNTNLNNRYTNLQIDQKIADIMVESGNILLRDVLEGETFELGEASTTPTIIYGNLIVSTTSLSFNEKETSSFTIKLDKAPTYNQKVNLTVNNAYCTLSQSSLTFTPSNYSTAQTIVVTGIHDTAHYSDKTSTITMISNNVANKTVSVTIKNIDTPPPTTIPVTGVTLNQTTHTLKVDETLQLIATVSPSNATIQEVTWSTSNSNATVEDGLVTAKQSGDCTITVTTKEGNKTATCHLTIEAKQEIIIPSGGYVTKNLDLMYDLTQYEDGYMGDVIDSVNNVKANVRGQASYTTGRNGFLGGKFMCGHHKTSAMESHFAIPNRPSFSSYPFTIEFYSTIRQGYNAYGGDNILEWANESTTTGSYQMWSTREGGTSGSGYFFAVKNLTTLNLNGSLSMPNTVIPHDIKVNNAENPVLKDRHVVVCLDADEQKIYVDGELIFHAYDKGTTLNGGTRELKFFTTPNSVTGDMKLVRVYNSMLSDDEVKQNYNHVLSTMGGE